MTGLISGSGREGIFLFVSMPRWALEPS